MAQPLQMSADMKGWQSITHRAPDTLPRDRPKIMH
jgi:hypothetical protein